MKKILISLIFFLSPMIILNNEIDKDNRYITVEEENFVTNYYLLFELKKELNELFEDINNFDVNDINPRHLLFMEEHRIKHDIPKSIFYRLILKESWFNENAISRVGAKGYMQIMPNTFEFIKIKFEFPGADIDCPYDNIKLGTKYLSYNWDKINERYLHDSDDMKWRRVLASYNAGYSDHLVAMHRYNETIEYIKFVLNN